MKLLLTFFVLDSATLASDRSTSSKMSDCGEERRRSGQWNEHSATQRQVQRGLNLRPASYLVQLQYESLLGQSQTKAQMYAGCCSLTGPLRDSSGSGPHPVPHPSCSRLGTNLTHNPEPFCLRLSNELHSFPSHTFVQRMT